MGPGSVPRGRVPAILLLLLAWAGARGDDRVVASSPAGECKLVAEWSEEWHNLRLRPFHPSAGNCAIGTDTMNAVLRAALAQLGMETGRTVESLYIGRVVDYPALSQALAAAASRDRRWNPKNGKPRRGDINAYVAGLLAKDISNPLGAVLAESGYRVAHASVEKVLVERLRNVLPTPDPAARALVPYDAQVWFRLERK